MYHKSVIHGLMQTFTADTPPNFLWVFVYEVFYVYANIYDGHDRNRNSYTWQRCMIGIVTLTTTPPGVLLVVCMGLHFPIRSKVGSNNR
jgi:hypothetical protein